MSFGVGVVLGSLIRFCVAKLGIFFRTAKFFCNFFYLGRFFAFWEAGVRVVFGLAFGCWADCLGTVCKCLSISVLRGGSGFGGGGG